MSDHYILSGPASMDGNPIPTSWDVWARWFQDTREERRVRVTAILDDGTATDVDFYDEVMLAVSTVFLGLDHSFGLGQSPVLWESLVFKDGSSLGCSMRRYASLEAAKTGHQKLVNFLCHRMTARLPINDDIDFPN